MLDPASARNRSPFTTFQWQELEHQALIYKYIISGVPVPPQLLYYVKRSLETSWASRLFPYQPIGWGCFQAGVGRKRDPEPGRCRRTDGKKWRCSKEAYPDSKYCERHMHRGRNRSRKLVEISSTTTTTGTISLSNPSTTVSRNLLTSTISPSSSTYCLSRLASSMGSEIYSHANSSHCSLHNRFHYLQSSKPSSSDFSAESSTTHNLFLDSGSLLHVDKESRYSHGVRQRVDETAFFLDASVCGRSLQNTYNQFTRGSYNDCLQSQFQSFADASKKSEQHCFVLGRDIKSSATSSMKLENEAETQKPLHHFFGEWQPKETDSWLDLASSSRLQTDD